MTVSVQMQENKDTQATVHQSELPNISQGLKKKRKKNRILMNLSLIEEFTTRKLVPIGIIHFMIIL